MRLRGVRGHVTHQTAFDLYLLGVLDGALGSHAVDDQEALTAARLDLERYVTKAALHQHREAQHTIDAMLKWVQRP